MTAALAYMYPKADRTIKNTSVAYFAKMVCDRATRRPALRSRARVERASASKREGPSAGKRLIMCNGGGGGQIPQPGTLIGFHNDQETPRFPVM